MGGAVAATFAATLVDEWARAGLGYAVVAPGSRSTPMALALASDPRIELLSRLDERSASFTALGIALSTGRPALVLTTSGTAAAELHAAVVEAHEARLPLIACTADRPPELHGVGANQTIDQSSLYGTALRYATDPGVPTKESQGSWRSLAARVFCEALHSPLGPGPVHLNLPFREPLDGSPGDLPPGRPGGEPWHRVADAEAAPDPASLALVLRLAASARAPLMVAGRGAGDPSLVASVSRRLGWPLLADPRSGGRAQDSESGVVCAADAICRPGIAPLPDLVLRLGEPWTSKALSGWLSASVSAGATHVVVDPHGEWRDPDREAALLLRCRPEALLGCLEQPSGPLGAAEGREQWRRSFARMEKAAQGAISERLGELSEAGELTEPLVARRLLATEGIDAVVASSSMPVRDVEWFSAARPGYPVVFSNRGASGIDGVVSTTAGVATGSPGRRVVGLLGDLAFLHDLSGLLRPSAEAASRAAFGLIVVDNRGGGIFSFLSQASSVEAGRFERLFATPQEADPARLAAAAGYTVEECASPGELDDKLGFVVKNVRAGHSPVLVLRTATRERNAAIHAELNAAVAKAVAASAGHV
jgi:2-succinyl-5-enolpyruvyl-6-hydroxy-3-cyclohexene-1-carboxylate synthase